MRRMLSLVCFSLALGGWAQAALLLNGAQPITRRVTVQPIIVSDTGGSNTATYLGDATQSATILSLIDQIWAQAGIDVEFLSPNFYNNTFANIGSATGAVARPTSDLNAIVTAGDLAGVGNSNPVIIDMYFVRAAAGFQVLGSFSAAGLAFVDANGITMYVGSDLLTFESGLEAIAKVIAHEIGHNLGLDHIVATENLMQSAGAGNQARLDAGQIAIATGSGLATTIPEPGTYLMISVALPLVLLRRRRATAGLSRAA